MEDNIMCKDCVRIKEVTNELELQRMEGYYDSLYYKKRLSQIKLECDELEAKLKAIEEILKK